MSMNDKKRIEYQFNKGKIYEIHPFILKKPTIVKNGNGIDITEITQNFWNIGNNPNWKVTETYFGYITEKSKHLFLGSFPPVEVIYGDNYQHAFFYGSNDNSLWRVLKFITNYNFNDNFQPEKFLDCFNISMTDVLKSIYRCSYSSSDKDLIKNEYNSLKFLLKENIDIMDIYFTSSNNSKNSPFGWFHDHIRDLLPRGDAGSGSRVYLNRKIEIFEREIKLHFLYSPSPSATLQIYNENKSDYYNKICNYYKINYTNLSNKEKADKIKEKVRENLNINYIEKSDVYLIFQWAKELKDIESLKGEKLIKSSLLDLVNKIFNNL